MSKFIVTSDQHLGYEHSDSKTFGYFLDYISNRSDVDALIMLGDLVDMWRRDVSGLFLIFSNIVNKILDVKSSGKEVYLIVGNHDYHLLKLKAQDYPFEFLSNWTTFPTALSTTTATGTKTKYIFKHGWEFELTQHPLIMEVMCYNLSDTDADERTNVYAFLDKMKDIDKITSDIANFQGGNQGYVSNLLQPPEKRLQPYLTDIEKKAWSSVNEGETLVFGHTHRPFISNDHRVVNAGSWVTDSQIHNTFVEIDEERLRIFYFKDKGVVNDITDTLILPTSI